MVSSTTGGGDCAFADNLTALEQVTPLHSSAQNHPALKSLRSSHSHNRHIMASSRLLHRIGTITFAALGLCAGLGTCIGAFRAVNSFRSVGIIGLLKDLQETHEQPQPSSFDCSGIDISSVASLHNGAKYGVSDRQFCRVFDKIYRASLEGGYLYEPGKYSSKDLDPLSRVQVSALLFREDDPSRTWRQRYLALKSSMKINQFFQEGLQNEQKLRQKNLLMIQQDNAGDLLFVFNRGLQDLYNVFFEKYSSLTNKSICQLLHRTKTRIGKPLDAVLIQGHGTKYTIELDKWKYLTPFSFRSDKECNFSEKVGDCFQQTLKEGAPIFLKSCNTGNRLQANATKPSIAEVIANATGHPVYAPTQALRDFECTVAPNSLTEGMLYCIKAIKWRDDDSDMKLSNYIQRFDPPSIQRQELGECPIVSEEYISQASDPSFRSYNLMIARTKIEVAKFDWELKQKSK